MKKFICDLCSAEIDKDKRKRFYLEHLEDLCDKCYNAFKQTADLLRFPRFAKDLEESHKLKFGDKDA